MLIRLVKESFIRNPRRKLLAAAALMVGMAIATATLTIALEVGDRLAREFRSLGANLVVTPQADTLPVNIGGVDYRPVDEGAYLREADLGKLKMIFWRHNILGFTPFLDVPVDFDLVGRSRPVAATLIGTWYQHSLSVPDGTLFTTGLSSTHPFWKIRGRWFADNADECVVGARFAAEHPGMASIGGMIRIAPNAASRSPLSLAITGIVSTGDAGDDAIFVPLSIAQRASGHPGQFRRLFVSALTKPADALSEQDPAGMTPAEHDRWFCSPYISSISFQIRQVLPGTDVRVIRRVAESEGRILTRVSTLLWIVTLAALIAAALAVAATSATTVLERRAEVGIMKAIGATNAIVIGIFLSEQLMLALVGGLVGYAVGTGLAWSFGASVFGSPATPRLILLPVIVGIAAAVAVFGSLIPLRRAAHFDPAPILRGE
ncbi:MAG TPA: ABC transporter permease [Candidatus Acidoferrales bacterium]|nr:ABC transporter permease [Candidatus Acidoferrales bacterium]